MSWLYSRALVEEFSEATSSDGAQSALLSGSPTPQAFLPSDRMTAFSRLSRFGMTFEPLMDNLGEDVLTWCQAASRARTYPSPAKAQALTAPSQECGGTWRGSLARFDPDTFSWRTAQPSLLEDLGESSVTWPRSGMTAAGLCWELPMLGRRIKGTDFGLWQTPVADDLVNRKEGKWNSRGEPKLSAQVLWPTPTVCGNYNRKGASTTSGDGLATAVLKWPTPRCSDVASGRTLDKKGRRVSPSGVYGANLADFVKFQTPNTSGLDGGSNSRLANEKRGTPMPTGGALNPTWVEWLMGWPLGWTDLKPLATDKFQPAQPPLGES